MGGAHSKRVIFAAMIVLFAACSDASQQGSPPLGGGRDTAIVAQATARALSLEAPTQDISSEPTPTSTPRPAPTPRPTATPIPPAQTHFISAARYYREGEFQKAVEEYTAILELEPGNTAAYGNRGLAYTQLGEIALAIEDFNRVIEIDPEDAKAHYNRGSRYGQLEEFDRAITDYDRSIELDPAYAAAYFARGLVYQELGRNQEATRDIQKAEQLGFVLPRPPSGP